MATILNTIYPPIVGSFLPAFIYNDVADIPFSLSTYNSIKDIKQIHVSVVDQRTNENALEINGKRPKVLVYDINGDANGFMEEDGLYHLRISSDCIVNNKFNTEQYYKIQLRFASEISGDGQPFSNMMNNATGKVNDEEFSIQKLNSYLSNRINLACFSEWSTVGLIRPIYYPRLLFAGFQEPLKSVFEDVDLEELPAYTQGDIHLVGTLGFFEQDGEDNKGNTSLNSTEYLENYTVELVDNEGNLVKDFDKLNRYTFNSYNPNEINEVVNLLGLELNTAIPYFFKIQGLTSNGYEIESYYPFMISDFGQSLTVIVDIESDDNTGNVTIVIQDEETEDKSEYIANKLAAGITEEPQGWTQEEIQESDTMVVGYIHVRRASNATNFKKWELVTTRAVDGQNLNAHINIRIEDSTTVPMYWYKYSVQFENYKGALSKSMIFDKQGVWKYSIGENGVDEGAKKYYGKNNENDYKNEYMKELWEKKIFPEFDDIILSRGDKQLSIRFNPSIQGFKPVVNRVKTDTLGGKYPKFSENAVLGYKQFSLSGLISSQMDDIKKFFTEEEKRAYITEECYDEYYEKTKGTATEKDPHNEHCYKNHLKNRKNNSNWLEDHDWLWERAFREEAMKWLNDGEPKLWRSLTEGGMAVMLTDISLTPNQTLGRRLYDFNCMVYEVEDGHSLDKLSSLGIYNVRNDSVDSNGTKYNIETFNYQTNYGVKRYNDFNLSEEFDNNSRYCENGKYLYGQYLKDSINAKYNGLIKNYALSKSKDGLLLSNLKIKFWNEPHIFVRQDGGEFNGFAPVYNPEELKDKDKQFIRGYFIDVKFYGDEDYTKVFVNERGYYQIPSKVYVEDIRFPIYNSYETVKNDSYSENYRNKDVFDIDFTTTYKIAIQNHYYYKTVRTIKYIIGQEKDTYDVNSNAGLEIYKKYSYRHYDNRELSWFERMNYWYGVAVDAEPGVAFDIKYADAKETEAHFTVGETGYINIGPQGHAIKDIIFKGRRLRKFKGAPINFAYSQPDTYYVVNNSQKPEKADYERLVYGNEIWMNGKWYPFTIDTVEVDGRKIQLDSGIVEMPVDAIVNYTGSLVKYEY